MRDIHFSTPAQIPDCAEMGEIHEVLPLLKKHEGFRAKVYQCSAGKDTIGYGWNLETGITKQEAEVLLKLRVAECVGEVVAWIGSAIYEKLSPTRRAVLIDMMYNLGSTRLAGFRKLRAAVIEGNWVEAREQMLDSLWARQVGTRATTLADAMATNTLPRPAAVYSA